MLVGTSAPETYSKFGLHLRRLARVRHACWYVRSNAYLLVRVGKKFLSAFPLPSALLGTENFFPFYVLPEVDVPPEGDVPPFPLKLKACLNSMLTMYTLGTYIP